jgi:diguanylate cyclase (GGDEF)-like protein
MELPILEDEGTMKRLIFILLAYGLVFLVFAAVFQNIHEGDRQAYIDGYLGILESRMDATIKNMGIFSRFVFETSVNNPEVTGLVHAAWMANEYGRGEYREALRQLMLPVYERLLKYDYRQLHFHLPDTSSLLRMHSPDNHGDILYSYRPTVRLANEKKIPVIGFEEGRVLNGYRFVYPLSHLGEHCGSVEISFSMGSFITILGGVAENDIIFGVKRSVAERTVFQQELQNYTLSPFSDDYLLDIKIQAGSIDTEIMEFLRPLIVGDLAKGEDFGIVLSHNERDKLVLFKAIKNLSSETVGYLVVASDDTGYDLLRTGYQLVLVIAFMALGTATFLTERLLVERSRLKAMAGTDQLTELANRHRFIDVASAELLRAKRHSRPVSMAIFDIDNFKSFNDSFGHSEGDRVLKGVAKTVVASIRNTDTLGRWGGEEFAAVLPFCDKASARRVAEKLRIPVCESTVSTKRNVTISVGVAEFDGSEDLDSLIARADSAMYKAKDTGRNCVACFEPEE